MPSRYAPMPFTCVPGETHEASKTGSADVVAQQMTSASRTAASAVSAASTPMPVSSAMRAANAPRAVASRA